MNIWQRHGILSFPFVAGAAAGRRALEELRLYYWRFFFGWKIGRNVRVAWSVHISRRIAVVLEDDVSIGRNCEIFSEVLDATFHMKRNSDIARGCMMDVSGGLVIGEGATISEGVVVYTHSHGRNPRSPAKYMPVEIGNRVWVCTRALILATAQRLGDNSVIGPYVVVRAPVAAESTLKSSDEVFLSQKKM
jgi:serine acetyltransferase